VTTITGEDLLPLLQEVYRDLHRYPELSFAEHRTAGVAANWLRGRGFAVTEGVGRTGVTGVLRRGEGPVVLLIHGITGDSRQWNQIIPQLADHYTVLAPDLLGHGQSAKPRGDYSLGAYAVSLRDLLIVLGHRRATVVGHSLGGGIAMQFAYEYPVFCERLVLVDSGGLGREVHPLLWIVAALFVVYFAIGPIQDLIS